MTSNNLRPDDEALATPKKSIHLSRLVILAVTVTGGLVAVLVLPQWVIVLTPRWLIRGATVGFLWSLLALYIVAVPAVVIGGGWSFLGTARAHKRRDRASLRQPLARVAAGVELPAGVDGDGAGLFDKTALDAPAPGAADSFHPAGQPSLDAGRSW